MNKYYVYHHLNPRSGEVIYVGHGSNHRAWVFNSLVFRQQAHLAFLKVLEDSGMLPCDWVVIIQRGLSKEAARKLEKEEIEYHNPKYNNHKGTGSLADKTKVKQARLLKEQGISMPQIKEKLKLKSIMTAWRYANVY